MWDAFFVDAVPTQVGCMLSCIYSSFDAALLLVSLDGEKGTERGRKGEKGRKRDMFF